MLIRNFTPFPILAFSARDVNDQEYGVVVLRGSFRFIPGLRGVPLLLHPQQEAVVEADSYHGLVGRSSVHMESDLAPYKPRPDVLVNAIATTIDGRRAPFWNVRIRVGKIEKSLRVTGPRYWQRQAAGWVLSESTPCTAVPIRYEYAFGGVWKPRHGEEVVCEANPVGVGFVASGMGGEENGRVAAPQIESLTDPVLVFGKVYVPEGLGPVGRAWQPRRGLAGTYDDTWMSSRHPSLPTDFNFNYYNSAPPGLVYPEQLIGNEVIELEGVHVSGLTGFTLPGYLLPLLLRYADGGMAALFANLDTVHIDVPTERVYLTWRGTYRQRGRLRALEARMTEIPRS